MEWIGETLKLCLNQRVCDVDKELFLFFVGSNTDEQDLSKKAAVICQDVKASSSVKSLQKGIESWKNEHNIYKSKSLFFM